MSVVVGSFVRSLLARASLFFRQVHAGSPGTSDVSQSQHRGCTSLTSSIISYTHATFIYTALNASPIMACAMRPTLLRQALAASSRPAMSPLSRAIPSTCQLQQRPALQIVQRAAFQTTAQRAILPPLPQRIPGGVNEAAHVPDPEPAHGSYHWSAERYHNTQY